MFDTDANKWEHKDYQEKKHKLLRIHDLLKGSRQIKHGPRYRDYILAYHQEGKEEYERRRERAHFINWFEILLGRMGGKLLRKEPTLITETEDLQERLETITKTGKGWHQLIANAAREMLAFTHGGILANFGSNDFPDPYLEVIPALAFIDWEFSITNRRSELTKVTIQGAWYDPKLKKEAIQYTVLRLVDYPGEPKYRIDVYQQQEQKIVKISEWYPLIFGKPIPFIPFKPLWPNSCSDTCMPDPILDPVAELTIDHLRNSALAELSLARSSIIQPVASGVKHILGPNGKPLQSLVMGSPEAWQLEQGGSFSILEAQGVGARLNLEAMKEKEARLQKISAEFVDKAEVPETATATNFRNTENTHTLSMVADSVTEIGGTGFGWIADWTLNPRPIFQMNKEFDTKLMDPTTALQWAQLCVQKKISPETLVYQLNRGGVYGPRADLEEELSRLEQETPAYLEPTEET